ncbi:SPATS2-like protein [Microcaecilia unicolor]|uniref:SPATS2-like protein n=1 Tax=Microcaecilia unicolor TaxID=1415580 RepID=A0A6P7YQN9_9AMPH|nr:SPATS2-like protein [Microcaecilia unicolor]
MAETNYQGNIKDKIIAVRSVVPAKSNNEIILVLQQFDNNVDKAIQAFLDGRAVQVLKEWNTTGKKKVNKKKKSKAKHQQCIKDNGDKANIASEGPQGIYGYHLKDCDKDNCSSEFTNEKTEIICHKDKTSTLEKPSLIHPEITEKKIEEQNGLSVELHPQPCNGIQMHQDVKSSVQQKLNSKPRSRPTSIKLHAPVADIEEKLADSIKKRGANIEKSVKDLQRCAVSLTRYHMIIKEDVDISVKKIKASFAELHSCIIEREVMLLSEVDKVKEEAMQILTARQKKAEELKKMTDLASQMAENQLSELRAEIKHFVSERKYDEELGRSARFSCDTEQLTRQIMLCGELSHPKNYYSLRPSNSSAPPAKGPHVHVETAKQNVPVQKSPSNRKISERKTTNTKALNGVPHNLTEMSRQGMLPSKQNGPFIPRRRFNARSHNIGLNGTVESPGISNEVDHIANKNVGQRRPQHNFKMRNKGMVKNQDQSSSMRTTYTLERKPAKVEAAATPSSNAAGVSQCYRCPANIEVPADPAVLSVPTITSVA